jgi:hypothetical protein
LSQTQDYGVESLLLEDVREKITLTAIIGFKDILYNAAYSL